MNGWMEGEIDGGRHVFFFWLCDEFLPNYSSSTILFFFLFAVLGLFEHICCREVRHYLPLFLGFLSLYDEG